MPKASALLPVILCGGTGTRLWPLSRASYPKQYWALAHNAEDTLLQLTQGRLKGLTRSPGQFELDSGETGRRRSAGFGPRIGVARAEDQGVVLIGGRDRDGAWTGAVNPARDLA